MREIYNGGITLGIGSYKLKSISSYQPKWEWTDDNSENLGTDKASDKPKRFSADITTGYLSESEMSELIKVLLERKFSFYSSEYNGLVAVKSVPKTYESANIAGIYCKCSFSIVSVIDGGISLGIGGYTLKSISSYQPKWTHEIDKSFENWDFTTEETLKGKRFSADITTGELKSEEISKLINVLVGRTFEFKSPEYNGVVKVENVPKTYKSANNNGIYCVCSFSIAAVSLDGSGGSL